MKIEFDLSNPQEVAQVAALIGVGHVAQTQQPQNFTAPATAAPAVAPAPAPAAAAPAPAPSPAPAPTPAPAPVASPSSGADHGALAAAMQNYAKAHGAGAAKAMLAKYGAKKVTDVPVVSIPQILGEIA